MTTIKDLSPQNVWKHFYALTQVPRPSGHLKKIQEFLVNFAKSVNVDVVLDKAGNVIMRKPATPGMEHFKGIVLQAHMDMVPQKNDDVAFDFENDAIQTKVDGDWLRACGTTLGADDGLGVATIMAIMEDKNLKHGPLEALITADEETGMFGASGLTPDELKGEILLNLDSEEEGVLYIGCAGGIDINASLQYMEVESEEDDVAVKISLKGLRGGHSGLEIDGGRANANKLMARFVREVILELGAELSSWQGGNMRNAIPRSCDVVLTLPKEGEEELRTMAKKFEKLYNEEFYPIEEGITLSVESVEMPETVVPDEIQDNLINAILACFNGVFRFIPTVPDTVETSCNLSIIHIGDGEATIQLLARSSSDSMKDFVATQVESCFAMAGMKVEFDGAYSGWLLDVRSPLLNIMKQTYQTMYGKEPQVKVMHAGVECGIIGATYPKMDMVSFGPTLLSPHSPDERAYIPALPKFYDFVVTLLKNGVQ